MTAIGKTVLVGLTYVDEEGEVIRREQLHGTITAGDENDFVEVRRADTGELTTLPPGLEPAEPGAYTLASTGEVVEDPDFVGAWTSHPPDPGE